MVSSNNDQSKRLFMPRLRIRNLIATVSQPTKTTIDAILNKAQHRYTLANIILQSEASVIKHSAATTTHAILYAAKDSFVFIT